jgi:hypothetical protein
MGTFARWEQHGVLAILAIFSNNVFRKGNDELMNEEAESRDIISTTDHFTEVEAYRGYPVTILFSTLAWPSS